MKLPVRFLARWGRWAIQGEAGVLALQSTESRLAWVQPVHLGSCFFFWKGHQRCLFADGLWLDIPVTCLPRLAMNPVSASFPPIGRMHSLTWEELGGELVFRQELSGLTVSAARYDHVVSIRHPSFSQLWLGEEGPGSVPPRKAQVSTSILDATATAECPPVREPPAVVELQIQTSSEAALPGWASSIGNEGIRRVLMHLFKFGQITESEVEHLTGSPRHARAFSNRLDEYRSNLPFAVEVEVSAGTKRFLKR